MTCTNCGAAVAENRRFCGKCGTDLAPEASSDPAPPSPYGTPTAPSAWGTGGAVTPPPPPPAPTTAPTGPADPFAPPNLDPGPYAGYPPPPGYGPPPVGYGAPGQYPPPGYAGGAPGQYPPGYGYPAAHTNGLAIASLVLGLIGWALCGVGAVVAIVLGFISRNQIKASWGRESGSGMATAGIVLGFIGLSFWIVIFLIGLFSNNS